MNWKKLFGSNSLHRGEVYYKSGNVIELYREGDTYYAVVEGRYEYEVVVTIKNDKVSGLSCDCPHAWDGHRCKHMAASLYAIEAEYLSNKKKDKTKVTVSEPEKYIKPFEVPSDGEYTYYNLSRITDNVKFRNYDFAVAKEMLENGELYPSDAGQSVGYYGNVLISEVMLNGGNHRYASVEVDRTAVRRLYCNCRDCYGKYYDYRFGSNEINPCVHQVAAFITLDEYIRKNNPGDLTDEVTKHMMNLLRRGKVTSASGEYTGRKIYIQPVLEELDNRFHVSFKVGLDKMYILKDIRSFVDAAEKNEIYSLGKKSSINFALDEVAEECIGLFDLMQERIQQIRENPNTISVKALRANGRVIDCVYDFTEGKSLEYKKNGNLKVTSGDIRLNFTVSPVKSLDGQFDGIRVSGEMPVIIEGMKRIYAVTEDSLTGINEESAKLIKVLSRRNSHKNINMNVGRKYLTEFYYNVLPQLQAIGDVKIEDEELITEFIPPEGIFRFYMDAEEGVISCRPVIAYGEEEYPLVGTNEKPEAFRDLRRESDVLGIISPFFEMAVPEAHQLICDENEDMIYNLITYGLDYMMEFGEIHSTDSFKRLKVRKMPRYSVGVSLESGLLNLSIGSTELTNEELLDILYSYRRKKKFHRLKNGDFITISDSSINELYTIFDSMHISPKEFVKGKMQLPSYRALYLDKMLESNEGIYAERDRHFRNLIKEFKAITESENSIPDELKDIMRGYQVYGFKWLSTLKDYGFGGILADEMGLGKTLQMIALMKSCKDEGTSLVICPASLVYNWQEEFFKFAPDMKVACASGSVKERESVICNYMDYDVIVTSYDLLKRDIDKYEGCSFAFEVIDEAQYIKNHSTAAAKSVKVISSKHKFALTGTPIENRLSELWSIFDYLMPGFLYSYDDFRKEFENDIVKYGNEDTRERLHKMVAPFILRRLKKDVLKDLPDKIEEVQYARLEGKQREVYEGQVVKMKAMLGELSNEDFRTGKIQVLAELMKLRQICCDPNLLFESYDGESAKREACMDLLTSAIEAGHKILLFSQFTSMLELLEKELKDRNIEYYKITGSTKKSERLELVNEFNRNSIPVFLISLKAGGTGLNLTGADVVIHYDPWWNVAAQNQATDRAHRIGQEKVVTVYRLIARDTIEERILKLQNEKKDLADSIISGDFVSITSMTKEDLMELF